MEEGFVGGFGWEDGDFFGVGVAFDGFDERRGERKVPSGEVGRAVGGGGVAGDVGLFPCEGDANGVGSAICAWDGNDLVRWGGGFEGVGGEGKVDEVLESVGCDDSGFVCESSIGGRPEDRGHPFIPCGGRVAVIGVEGEGNGVVIAPDGGGDLGGIDLGEVVGGEVGITRRKAEDPSRVGAGEEGVVDNIGAIGGGIGLIGGAGEEEVDFFTLEGGRGVGVLEPVAAGDAIDDFGGGEAELKPVGEEGRQIGGVSGGGVEAILEGAYGDFVARGDGGAIGGMGGRVAEAALEHDGRGWEGGGAEEKRQSGDEETRKVGVGRARGAERGLRCGRDGIHRVEERLRVEEFGIPWGSREGWLEGGLDF